MDFHQVIVARLQGSKLKNDFSRYLALVQSGIAGFVVFEAALEELKGAITKLQAAASMPLIIASDLEQGLGQQVSGGTTFPPARAIAEATKEDPALRARAFTHMALEARAAGINTVFAPVLDIDSNPDNPIISTRAPGSDIETVSKYAMELIEIYEAHGIRTCGKHFPGHGDTEVDSHLALPVLNKTLEQMQALELRPFEAAVRAGVPMMMLAHMNVPSLDNKVPTSVSAGTVRLLRAELGFKGIIITDALDMGALKELGQERAAEMALAAGVDLILHPSEPEALALNLAKTSSPPKPDKPDNTENLKKFRQGLLVSSVGSIPEGGYELSLELSRKSLKVNGECRGFENLVIASDEGHQGNILAEAMGIKALVLNSKEDLSAFKRPDGPLVLAIYSSVRAYKGGASGWLKDTPAKLNPETTIAFGPPVLLKDSSAPLKITAWWGGDPAERAVAELLSKGSRTPF